MGARTSIAKSLVKYVIWVAFIICSSTSTADNTRETELRLISKQRTSAYNSGQINRFLNYHQQSPNFIYVSDGTITRGFGSWQDMVIVSYESFSRVKVTTREELVQHINPSAAVLTQVFEIDGHLKTGKPFRGVGTHTLVFKEMNDNWTITTVIETLGPNYGDLAKPKYCDELPRPENAALENVEVNSQWYKVYKVAEDVYALLEPYQWQEVISFLIVGAERALLFDSGLGMEPIRPVVEELTHLPIMVFNSHTHFDHVGGNHEFTEILSVDSLYTQANMNGFSREELAEEAAPSALCHGLPETTETNTYRVKPWQPSQFVYHGDIIDLGGRELEILLVPGHTPDAAALLDKRNGLLFTGDTYYDARLWLFVPETNMQDYLNSLSTLTTALEQDVQYLLPAHNIARVKPEKLLKAAQVVNDLYTGLIEGKQYEKGRINVEVDGVKILTTPQALAGKQSDISKGGSGLTAWPLD